MTEDKVGAIIVAAGKSRRMGGVDKVFADLGGKPVLARVLDVFQECKAVDQVVVVLAQESLERGQNLIKNHHWTKITALCPGGERRQDSVREGLGRLSDCQWGVIHDGARPLLTVDLIEQGLIHARESGAAVAAMPVKDTIKKVSADSYVKETPDRNNLWTIQTPQVFHFDLLSQAHQQIVQDVSDDAMMVEKLGHKVRIYPGSYRNIKVTTSEDLAIAEVLLREQAN